MTRKEKIQIKVTNKTFVKRREREKEKKKSPMKEIKYFNTVATRHLPFIVIAADFLRDSG